ncbi:MAG: PHB depolymerase family esterase [Hydrogenophaga sp.]|nr:PHB depolymerase family esterase [Hydrogenophaga sp.]
MKARGWATSTWMKSFNRSVKAMARAARPARRTLARSIKTRASARASVDASQGSWTAGMALGPAGTRRYRLFRPPEIQAGERLPLVVMLHGCGQDANDFAASTRMNLLARRERFLVLYPEQDRLSNAQRCWNWYETRNGRAQAEAALVLAAIDQICLLQNADPSRVALIGLSAGAGLAALLATRHPHRFAAVVMHSGVAPGVADSTATALAAMRGRRLQPAQALDDARETLPWPPLLVIQGESDHVVVARNGAAAAQVWATAVGATATPGRVVQRGQRYPMTVTDFKRHGRTLATLVTVERLGHAWSGGASRLPFGDAKGPDASRMAWAFAARQFRQTAPQSP